MANSRFNPDRLLDSDVAELYGVKTKEVNQAVINNSEKFPQGYIFELNQTEKNEVVKKFDHLSNKRFSPYLPKAFTEKGLYMLATILKSSQATQTTIAIIEAFSKLKTLSRNIKILSATEDESYKRELLKQSGELITEILDDNTQSKETETIIELNFAVLKFKHTQKKISS